VQDLGRWGYQSRGVPVSGALDWFSHRLANLLVGNDPTAAGLEVTLTGPQVRFERATSVAVTGAEFALTLDDQMVEMNQAVDVRAGSVLRFGERMRGARAYISVAGGVDVSPVLGSRSTHVVTAMGGHEGRALRVGDALVQGETVPGSVFEIAPGAFSRVGPLFPWRKLRVVPVDPGMAKHLTGARFRISSQSNRMGYRLEGATVATKATGELVSTAVPTGAIQIPPTGQPILLMNDHATTGGYQMAGVVITADLPVAGQLAPGDWVEFETCSVETADRELRQLEALLGPH
jgi:biotin-dependent carboxylase-like uncharacterized protein